LASKIVNNANLVQFEYNGRTATLRTAAEIAAWIAERKKRYPTQAKAEAAKKEAAEKKRKWAEVKKQREEAAQAKRLEREKARQEELRLKALESKKRKDVEKEQKQAERARNEDAEEDEDHKIRAKKAKIKAEKLRLKANKAELKVLEAEAAARKAKKRRGSLQSSTLTQGNPRAQEISSRDADSAIAREGNGAETATQADVVESGIIRKIHQDMEDPKNKAGVLSTNKGEDDDEELISDSPSSPLSISDSSALSDAELTSSSASSSDSSDSDSDSTPEQTTSKRLRPTRVTPPPRRPPTYTNHLCRSLLATGRCPRGDECRYSHDLPDTLPSLGERKDKLKGKRKMRLGKVKAAEGPAKKEGRKGLWQVMVEKEQEEERKQLLRAIVFMGERGLLGEDEKKAGEVDGTA
jgi:Nuclear fragile X mental retardation-interacting protein 1 (NUFIP1)/Zinc finger C-x8-C-x5-C-x3-H type (and similar)